MMKRIFYFFAICLALVACEDDDSFSTSTGLRLTFSVDTLQMDTVFSRTPSSTYTFWVRNQNDDGVRLSMVKLRRGNQSGFRVNVDGVYLDNSNGSQTSNVEIRKNDSILVFVELTATETRQAEPKLVEDDLLFLLESGTEQKVCLQAWAWDARKIYDPVFENDSLIESDIPLVIYGDMMVNEGVTLTVKNTTLYFHDASGVYVFGTLKTENCLMRGDRLDHMFDYLPYDRVSGQWGGISFARSSVANELTDTEIRNAMTAVSLDSAAIDSTAHRLTMTRCVVHNAKGNGIVSRNSFIGLYYCQLSNTLGDCLSLYGGMVDIDHCTLAQFYPFNASRGSALRFVNDNGLILYCTNSIMTGYDDDVVMGECSDTTKLYAYQFVDCLMRTPEVKDDTVGFKRILWETPKDTIQGKKHFVKIDEGNLDYDFHLDSLSTAKGKGCYPD